MSPQAPGEPSLRAPATPGFGHHWRKQNLWTNWGKLPDWPGCASRGRDQLHRATTIFTQSTRLNDFTPLPKSCLRWRFCSSPGVSVVGRSLWWPFQVTNLDTSIEHPWKGNSTHRTQSACTMKRECVCMVCHSTAFAHNLPSSVLLSDSLSLSLENKGNFSEEILLRKREFGALSLPAAAASPVCGSDIMSRPDLFSISVATKWSGKGRTHFYTSTSLLLPLFSRSSTTSSAAAVFPSKAFVLSAISKHFKTLNCLNSYTILPILRIL